MSSSTANAVEITIVRQDGAAAASGQGEAEVDDLRVGLTQAQRQVARNVENHRHLDTGTLGEKNAQLLFWKGEDLSVGGGPDIGRSRQDIDEGHLAKEVPRFF